jgi:G3E family GTPase
VIETTGLADPGPLAGIFWLDDELESDLVLDGVVTVVDLANIDARLNDERANEARLQIAYADRIVLNKRELVSWESFEKTMARIRTINPLAQLEATSYGRVDLNYCLNIGAYDASRLRLRTDMGDVDHDPAVKSVVLRREDRPIDTAKLRDWIASLLWEPPEGTQVFRIKGVVWGADSPEKVRVIQGVHKLFDIADLDLGWSDIDERKAITKVVVIGRIDPKAIKLAFANI